MGSFPAFQHAAKNQGIYAIFEDMMGKSKAGVCSLSVPNIAKLMKIVTRVVRGADCMWGGSGHWRADDGWIRVQWDNASTNSYRMGKEGKYDLKPAETPHLTDSDSDTDTDGAEVDTDLTLYTGGDHHGGPLTTHPSKMIKQACYHLMRSLTLGVATHTQTMQGSAVSKVTSILRQIIQLGCQSTNCITAPEHLLLAKDQYKGWASLGFIRSACLQPRFCVSMCSPAWIQLLFSIVEDNDQSGLDSSLPTKVLALRLLTSILLLRVLHKRPTWSKKINEFICLKMSLVNEIISKIAILQMPLSPRRWRRASYPTPGSPHPRWTAARRKSSPSSNLSGASMTRTSWVGSRGARSNFSDVLSNLNPVSIAGGSKSLFLLTNEGKVFACGEGTNGRLGLGHCNNVPLPRQLSTLSQYVVYKVRTNQSWVYSPLTNDITGCSGGKHAMHLTVDDRVFSWEEGYDGKLGLREQSQCCHLIQWRTLHLHQSEHSIH